MEGGSGAAGPRANHWLITEACFTPLSNASNREAASFALPAVAFQTGLLCNLYLQRQQFHSEGGVHGSSSLPHPCSLSLFFFFSGSGSMSPGSLFAAIDSL